MSPTRHDLVHLTTQEKRELLVQLLREKTLGREEDFPLSFGQQGLWLMHQVAPQSAAYNVVLAVRMRPPLNVRALQSAVRGVIQRHGMLRSVVKIGANGPVQTLRASVDLSLEPVDAKDWTEEELRARLLDESRRAFVLEESSVRVILFARPAGEHVLLFVAHHVAFDAWSLGLVITELQVGYNASVSGEAPAHSPLRADYRDFVEWQAKMLNGPEGESSWGFWRDQLSGDLPTLELPTDYPRPAVTSFRGASFDFTLAPHLAGALRKLSQNEGQTPFSVLLSAFSALLHRYSGQTDLLIGTPTAGRSRAEFEGVVGYFVSPVVIRANVEGDPSFTEFLARLGLCVRNALRHADFPFPVLVQRLQPVRDASRSPIFQVLFNYFRLEHLGLHEHMAGASRAAEGLVIETISLPQQEGQFDLSLEVGDADDALICTLKYSTDLFDRRTIQRMAHHYEQLLTAVLADPTRRLSQLPLVSAAEHAQLRTWNATGSPYRREGGLLGVLGERVAQSRDAIAVRQGTRYLTYAGLEAAADRVAGVLWGLGVGPNVLVGVCLDRTPTMLVALLGVLKAGGAYVPLDPAYPVARLAFMLEDSGVQVVLTETAHAALIPTRLAHIVCLDRDRALLKTTPSSGRPALPAPEDLAYVIYTSGSTGQPKGVEISHGALVNLLTAIAREPGFTATDTLLAVTTLSFDIAALELFLPLFCGGTVVLATREEAADPQALMTLLAATAATVMQATPVTWRMLIEAGWKGTPSLKVLCGGEALPRDLASGLQARTAEVWNMYGPTETTIWSSASKVESRDGPVPIGRPIANTQVHVLDRWGNPQPVGVVGELYIGGDGLARGYRNRPDLTEERFVADPFSGVTGARLYRTGDLARWRPDGTIECLGRMDHQVKVRGFRIELGEIEAALASHPDIGSAVVLSQKDGAGETRLVAYLTGASDGPLRPADLRQHMAERLPIYMVPAAFVWLQALPLTPNGKVDRRALARLDPCPSVGPHEGEPPRDALDHQIAQIWEEVLSCGSVGIDDNFFDLGGHSLLAVRMLERVAEVCGKRLPVSALFAGATIRHLASTLLEQSRESFACPVTPIQVGGSRLPFFFLHGDYTGGGFYCRELARHVGPDQPFYVFHPRGLDGGPVPATIEAMADEYLRTLRAFRPGGPYLLGGYCNGGLVAFEMARRLREQGERVDFLLAIDSRLWNARFRWLHVFTRWLGTTFRLTPEDQQQLFLQMRMLAIVVERNLKACRTHPREILQKVRRRFRGSQPTHQNYSRLDVPYGRAVLSYVPPRYPGRVAVFLSAEAAREGYDRGWRGIAEEIDVRLMPGTHVASITRHVKVAAGLLKACLDAVQGQKGRCVIGVSIVLLS